MSFMVNKADLDAALKRTTIMVDKKVSRIIFKISSGVLKLISPESDIGTADEEIPCRYDGQDQVKGIGGIHYILILKMLT